jgi:hypothetical protein
MNARRVVGIVLVLAGVVWSVMFPKKGDVLAFDFVGSVAIGLGLILTGFLVYRLTRARLVPTTMGIFLVWSLLMNACLVAEMHARAKMLLDHQKFAREHRR